MSASDENQSDAKGSPPDVAKPGAGPTIENHPVEPSAPSSFGRKLKLYGILFAVLAVGVLAAAGTYPYWRANVDPVFTRVGLDLEDLETSLGIPRWLITHGRQIPKSMAIATGVAPATSDKTEIAPKSAASAAPAPPVSTPAPPVGTPATGSEEWREATEGLSARLSLIEVSLSGIAERLEVLESAPPGDIVVSTTPPPTPLTEIPTDIVQQLEKIAARVVDLETHRKDLAMVEATPARSADSGALIAAVVALAERVGTVEARGSLGVADLAALRDDTLALTSRLAGLDDRVKQVGAAMEEDTPGRDRAALFLLSVGQLAVATASVGPYETQLDALRSVAGDQADLADPLDRLAAHAATGAPTFVALRAAFTKASSAVIRSRDVGSSESVLGQTLARVASLVTIRKVDDVASGTVDGVLAAADLALGAGDLAGAVTAVQGLDGAPGEAIAGWLTLARARLAVDRALSDLQALAIRALAAAG